MHAKGHNGQLEFDGQTVTITRKGLIAGATVGHGATRIPLASITAIEFKRFSIFYWGHLRLVVHGGDPKRPKAIEDPQAVTFRWGQQQRQFEQIRDAIETALTARLNQ